MTVLSIAIGVDQLTTLEDPEAGSSKVITLGQVRKTGGSLSVEKQRQGILLNTMLARQVTWSSG